MQQQQLKYTLSHTVVFVFQSLYVVFFSNGVILRKMLVNIFFFIPYVLVWSGLVWSGLVWCWETGVRYIDNKYLLFADIVDSSYYQRSSLRSAGAANLWGNVQKVLIWGCIPQIRYPCLLLYFAAASIRSHLPPLVAACNILRQKESLGNK